MRFLADENMPGDAIDGLRSRGHDVAWVRTDAPGSSDPDVLARATAEDRVLLTFDKDFGELAFHSRLPASSGVVLFRIALPSPRSAADTIVAALESRTDWAEHFSVVDEYRVRMTSLPPQQ